MRGRAAAVLGSSAVLVASVAAIVLSSSHHTNKKNQINQSTHPTNQPISIRYGHGLISAAEVLSFLIECVARRDGAGPHGPGDEEYVVFGLQVRASVDCVCLGCLCRLRV